MDMAELVGLKQVTIKIILALSVTSETVKSIFENTPLFGSHMLDSK